MFIQDPSLNNLSIIPTRQSNPFFRYIKYFNRPEIDGWDVRQGMTDLLGLDVVPDPKVIIAAMYACRRVNDYSLAVRFLEAVKDKCGVKMCEIYPYIIQEIAPVICELGVDTPEILGYDKPECYVESVFDMWTHNLLSFFFICYVPSFDAYLVLIMLNKKLLFIRFAAIFIQLRWRILGVPQGRILTSLLFVILL